MAWKWTVFLCSITEALYCNYPMQKLPRRRITRNHFWWMDRPIPKAPRIEIYTRYGALSGDEQALTRELPMISANLRDMHRKTFGTRMNMDCYTVIFQDGYFWLSEHHGMRKTEIKLLFSCIVVLMDAKLLYSHSLAMEKYFVRILETMVFSLGLNVIVIRDSGWYGRCHFPGLIL